MKKIVTCLRYSGVGLSVAIVLVSSVITAQMPAQNSSPVAADASKAKGFHFGPMVSDEQAKASSVLASYKQSMEAAQSAFENAQAAVANAKKALS